MEGSRVFLHAEGSTERRHHVLHCLSVVLAITSQVLSDIFCTLASDRNIPNGLFNSTSGDVSETFPLEVTMDRWADNNWVMLCIWNYAWLMHSFIRQFQRNVLGPVSCNPEIHPPSFYVIWAVINAARIGGMLLWHKQNILGALFFKWTISVHSFHMLFVSYWNLYRHRAWLGINNPRETWYIRYLTQNGLAVFAWWTLMEALVCLGVVLKYWAGLSDPLVSSLVLTLLLLGMLIWFVFESFIFTKYIRYTFTVYPVLIVGLGAMFSRGYYFHHLSTNTVYCGFMMLIATVLNSVRLIATCFYPDEASKPFIQEPYSQSDCCKSVYQPEGKNCTVVKTGISTVFCKN